MGSFAIGMFEIGGIYTAGFLILGWIIYWLEKRK
jgi:hypothetical protein